MRAKLANGILIGDLNAGYCVDFTGGLVVVVDVVKEEEKYEETEEEEPRLLLSSLFIFSCIRKIISNIFFS
jgi:hypothetical protein